MMRVAIVEDEAESAAVLQAHFARYGKERGCTFAADVYTDAESFITGYRPDYDLVLFDIEMPGMNGMKGAQKLREVDPYVPIVFVTNMARYAVKGYSVGAIDFIIKPVGYFDFSTMVDKVRRLRAAQEERMISVTSAGVIRRIPVSHILYVEIYRHKLTFHTVEGDIEAWGSLSEVEAQLPAESFCRCNNSFLVNFKYVDGVEKEEVTIGKVRLPVSHLRRKDFLAAIARYLGLQK